MSAPDAPPEAESGALSQAAAGTPNASANVQQQQRYGDTHDGDTTAALEHINGYHEAATPDVSIIKEEHLPAAKNVEAFESNGTATTLRPAPLASVKRRESEAGESASEVHTAESSNKKRKRGVSPPWHFGVAQQSTIKTADGRRVSARVNTGTPGQSESEGRARSNSRPKSQSQSRAPSPPWKKVAAEGPSTISVNGVRKSGRMNRELGEAPKRVSPRSKKTVDKLGNEKTDRDRANSAATKVEQANDFASRQPGKDDERPSSAASKAPKIERPKSSASDSTRSRPDTKGTTSTHLHQKRSHKKKPSHDAVQPDGTASPSAPPPTRKPSHSAVSPELGRPSPRIKLRFGGPRRHIDHPHPKALPPVVRPPLPSIHQVIERYELQELQQPYAENERGPPDAEEFARRARRQAEADGCMRTRLLEEAKPGGLLSKEVAEIYRSDQQSEPPQQYDHRDYLVAHALWLRKLQIREKTEHKLQAKKLALEAQEVWRKKRGPTQEDLEAEAARVAKLIYKQVAADVKAKWELVQQYFEHERLERWQAEEDKKRQERLRERLAWSENMVAKQRGGLDDEDEDMDSAMSPSEAGDSGLEDGDEDGEEENMSDSSSSDEDDEGADADMDEDALAAYLASREADQTLPNKALDSDAGMADDETPLDAKEIQEGVEQSKYRGTRDHSDRTTDGLHASTSPTLRSPQVEEQKEHSAEPPVDAGAKVSSERVDEQPLMRSRRSGSQSLTQAEKNAEGELSDDESTDMDSTDYDSDEDMSSTDDEAHGSQAEEATQPTGSDEEGRGGEDPDNDKPVSLFSSLFSKKEQREMAEEALPTPPTGLTIDETADGTSEPRGEESKETVDSTEAQLSRHAPAPPLADMCKITETDKPPSDSDMLEAGDATREDAQATQDDTTLPTDEEPLTKGMVQQPVTLRGTLRTYQHAGLDWLASLYRNGTNGILADEMGLGKTIQTISLLAHLAENHEVWETHLVVVPTSVILNWVTEFQKFLPGFRVLAYHGSTEERQLKRRHWVNDPHHENKDKRGYNAIVTSYNVAMKDINAIRNVQWHYLILDEAHTIRNFNSQRWQLLIRLKTRARLLLTGTPLQNSLSELWSLLTFLTAGDDDAQHGDLEEFLSHWKEPVKEIFDRGVQTLSVEAQKVVDNLHVSLRPFLLRRLKTEVEKDLPKKTESVVVCKLSKRQRQLYQDFMGLEETRKQLTNGNAVTAGRVLLSLRRVCNHPDLFDPRPIQTSFGMEITAVEPYTVKERLIRRLLGTDCEAPALLQITGHENRNKRSITRCRKLAATDALRRELRGLEAEQSATFPDLSTIAGCRALQRLRQKEHKLQHLRDSISTTEASLSKLPIYGSDLYELTTVHHDGSLPSIMSYETFLEKPDTPVSKWVRQAPCDLLQSAVSSLAQYAERYRDGIVRFGFCTPAVTAPNLNAVIPNRTQELLRASPSYPSDSDPLHEPRVRLSIAFPDSRLLIYDAGKLQRLTLLLRDLQARQSRSLIFTQMTGTLDVLERFLNLLNLPYLRLDGSTSVERRQLYTAEFNRPDSKYACMILSSRAGGIGLNLTGASSVIFYDLDWNPQMDRQCMDRAHRIGQVRDVEVYKMVSERTVEENILRRANQKSLLDQTVIQEGQFTTEYKQQSRVEEVHDEPDKAHADGSEDLVSAAAARVFGVGEKAVQQTIESVEDKDDVLAAQKARKEEQDDETRDDVGHQEKGSRGPSVPAPSRPGSEGLEGDVGGKDEEGVGHVDGYMCRFMEQWMENVPFVPPVVKKTDARGRRRDRNRKR
ncbi:hypothetical protein MBLNU230_g5505t1 [Neophaeotheca triangularis]